MKLHSLMIVGLALCMTACAEKKEPAPEPQAAPPAEPVAAESPAVEQAPAAEEAVAAAEESARDGKFIDHMHAHAEQLDNLNFALADDDLEGAMTAAYWLAGHQEVAGIQEDWRPYLQGMRDAAQAVEEASDLDAARAAAERISTACQGCHEAAGVND
jgi:cytochrome c556